MNDGAETIGMDTICSRSSEVLHSAVGETVLALAADTGDSYSFEGPSGRIWDILEAPSSPRQIAAILTAEFEIAEDACAAQVCSFLGRLYAENLITLDNGSN